MKKYWGIRKGLVASLVIAVGALLTMRIVVGRSLPFEAGEWKAGDLRLRWRMVNDPQLAPSLVGLTEDVLQQRLGKPDNLLIVRHPPPDKVYLYWVDRPLDPFRWNLKLCIEQGVVAEVFIQD